MFKGFGFDRVFHQKSDINAALADLHKDLSRVHAQF
jgi:methylmalonyl-CoA mutase cobalamin-binding subunit